MPAGRVVSIKATHKTRVQLTVCILAGGLSRRMGRDKSRLRLGGRTMLGHIRAVANQLGFPVRVIRHDSVPRSGPIGGIYTALQKYSAEKVLFLACDMPFISSAFLGKMIKSLPPSSNAAFALGAGRAGFPCLLRRESCLPVVTQQIDRGKLSLQALAGVLKAKRLRLPRGRVFELTNINTPLELEAARRRMVRGTRTSGRVAEGSKSCRTPKVY